MTGGLVEILALTHLGAALAGSLITLLFFPKRKTGGTAMSNKFVSILKDVGKGLLFIFTNKTAEAIESSGLNLATLVWPGLAPLFATLSNAIAKAQAQAAVSTAGLSTEEVIALVLTDAQADFQTAGITETARQQAIVAAAITFIDEIPSGSVNAAVVNAAVNQVAGAAPPVPVPAAQQASAPGPVAVAAPAAAANEPRLIVPA
jgi:hypothetical protein